MQPYDVQSVAIDASTDVVFRYLSDRYRLPEWTHAFRRVTADSATLETPGGAVDIALSMLTDADLGVVDWFMTFPDRSRGRAHARIVRNVDDSTILTFVLLAPPAPQELVEGALEQQKAILRRELANLKGVLETRDGH